MAAPEANKTPADTGAESPTTARPLEMDDDDVQEPITLHEDAPSKDEVAGGDKKESTSADTPAATTTAEEPAEQETAPPKPPRPLTEAQKNVMILKEAFPSVEEGVIKAVLSASGGKVEPAFNALLEMTDPDAAMNEPTPPPQPPRPANVQNMSQMEADERYARQLAEHFDNVGAYEQRTSNRQNPQRSRGQGGESQDDREHSFIDDDLPIIRDNLRKGFQDTQVKVNGWISQLRKRIEDNFDESNSSSQQQQAGEAHRTQTGSGRPSGDYDADPQVLSDDFAGMRFSGEGNLANRSMASQSIYPPRSSSSPRSGDGRRVAFQQETEEITMNDRSPQVPPKDAPLASGTKSSKWQPLSTVEPSPISDNDPFSLGDSDDEKEAKEKPKDGKDSKGTQGQQTADEERLKAAAAEAMADSIVEEAKAELRQSQK